MANEKVIPTFTMSEVAAMSKEELVWATDDRTPATPEDDKCRVEYMAIFNGIVHPLAEHSAPRINFSKSGKALR